MSETGTDVPEDYEEEFKVVTANRLRDGRVVYLSLKGDQASWTTRAQSATVFTGAETEAALEIAAADVAANLIVGAYATEITGKNQPLGAKEELRAAGGPSIRFGEAKVTPKDPDYSI
ncbi:MAG: DUF2849 domain-containing protein [Rhodospirillales bacterium]